jgi:hypothetical protein
LTAGQNADAELILHEMISPISADIVDNAVGGHVALVVDEGTPHLSGHNTYTGGTWVTGSTDELYDNNGGTLWIDSYSAIPANDRVYVDNGLYNLQNLAAGTVHLDELHVREGGIVNSGAAAVDAKRSYLEKGSIRATLTGTGAVFKDSDGVVDIANASPNFTGVVTIRDGLLQIPSATTLSQANSIVVEGGEFDVNETSGFTRNVVLRGGTLGAGRFTGQIDVQSESTIYHSTSTTLAGQLTGSGDLIIRGRQDHPFDYYVGMFGNASQYSGNIRIESGALRVGTPSNAGSGKICVMQAGRFVIGSGSSSNPNTTLNNEIHIYGGTLYSYPPGSSTDASPSILTGNVFVHEEAFIGALQNGFKNSQRLPGLTFSGQLTLSDGSDVYGLSDGRSTIANGDIALVDIAGELRVGANTTWHLLTSSLSISGLVRPTGVNSSINFEGIPTLLRMGGAAIQVDAGQSLSILLNGQAANVQLSGSGNTIEGSGLLHGDYTVTAGAAISPGNSPGLLSLDGNTTFAAGGHLSIELAGTTRGTQYDSLDVSGDVIINGGLLDVSLIGGFVPAGTDGFVLLRGHHVSGKFANALSSIVVGGQTMPVTYLDQMVVLGNAAAVPEPGTLLLAMLGLCFGCRSCRHRACRRH